MNPRIHSILFFSPENGNISGFGNFREDPSCFSFSFCAQGSRVALSVDYASLFCISFCKVTISENSNFSLGLV